MIHDTVDPHFAVIQGEKLSQLPEDLYIPPDALEVFLETFEGPLDLLLYLIKKQNLDILNIPIAEITLQYVQYVNMMQQLKLDLAADYLLMAAMLAEIKSRILLPKREEVEEEEDPRAELVRRLQEYEQFKQAAENIEQLSRNERDYWPIAVEAQLLNQQKPLADISLDQIVKAFQDILQRLDINSSHEIKRNTISIRARMADLLERLQNSRFLALHEAFNPEEGRHGLVVSLMAVLELLKDQLIDVVQNQPYASIYLKLSPSYNGDHNE